MAACVRRHAWSVRPDTIARVLGSAGNRRRFVIEGVAGRGPEKRSRRIACRVLESEEVRMPTPQILADIVRLLIQLLPAMALVSLVLAGIALRLEGGSTFLIGGSF